MKRYVFLALMSLMMVAAVAQPPRHHHRSRCAAPEQMRMVMQTLEKQSFDDNRLEVAELCVVLGQFCVSDLERMAKVFSFDDKRLEFLKFAYDYCTDPLLEHNLLDAEPAKAAARRVSKTFTGAAPHQWRR